MITAWTNPRLEEGTQLKEHARFRGRILLQLQLTPERFHNFISFPYSAILYIVSLHP